MRKRKAFTLIEMVLVVTIIALLATLVLTRMTGRGKEAKVATAKTQIGSLRGALGSFEMDCDRFPTAAEGLQALVERPAGMSETTRWRKYLMKSKIPTDPWGNDYIYRCPGVVNEDYDIVSRGPDGKEGTDDDIGDTPG